MLDVSIYLFIYLISLVLSTMSDLPIEQVLILKCE